MAFMAVGKGKRNPQVANPTEFGIQNPLHGKVLCRLLLNIKYVGVTV